MSSSPFVLTVSDLLGTSASSRRETVRAPVDWKVELHRVMEEPPLTADLVLHPVSGGIAVTGTASFTTIDSCYRCLRETTATRQVAIGALFDRNDDDDETYPLEGHEIDTEQMLRDEVLLSLPIAEVCGDDCEGVVSSAQNDLNTDLSADAAESRSPFAVLKDLLDSED
ncbi:MAG: YceD family protein [Acidimicrobiia bacterium]